MFHQGDRSVLRCALIGFLTHIPLSSAAGAQAPALDSSKQPLAATSPAQEPAPAADKEHAGKSDQELELLLNFLDRNSDGRIAPYEGAEAMLLLNSLASDDPGAGVDSDELRTFLKAGHAEELEEQQHMFEGLDTDRDGSLAATEVPEEFRGFHAQADTDGDGCVSLDELLAAEDLGDPRQMFEQELLDFFGQVDSDGDGAFALSDLPEEDRAEFEEQFTELDRDANRSVTKQELFALLEEEMREATFEVRGSTAFMSGVIGPSTPGRVLELLLEHPGVETIAMLEVPGSMDDEANLRAASYVRKHGLATSIPAQGEIASGGTDFFLAGITRTAEVGARFGVHSWSGFDEEGADVPKDDPEHEKYLDYYDEMGIPPEFYWYTLEAAPADDIHWMTREEIDRYGMLTSPMTEASGPAPNEHGAQDTSLDIDTTGSSNGIVPLTEDVPSALQDTFVKYTRIVAPNGGPIHFFAQDGVSDAQLVRAREVMRFYLTDAPGTRFGADKTAVANAMADNRAGLVYFNTERDAERAFRGGVGDLDLFLQDLYAEESVVEGSADYLANSVRDATLEEVFHLVQGAGIQPALPAYHARIEEAMRSAVENKHWFTNEEWEAEGSSSFEYIISVIDVFYGFWAHNPHGNGESFHGEYRYCTRAAITEKDPLGVEVLREFLPDAFRFPASIAADFEGSFTLSLHPDLPYTRKSQYFTDVRLTGTKNSGLIGNDQDNELTGNSGTNLLEGRGGDDQLVGGEGEDTAVFRGHRAEYEINVQDGIVHVADQVPARDGITRLREVEQLRFADGTIQSPD